MKKKGSKRRKKNKNKDESKSEQEENRNPGLYLYYSTNIYENDNIHTDFTDKKSIFYCRDKYNNNLIFPKENQTEINEQFEIGFRARKSKNDYYELIYPIIKIPFSDYSEIDKLNNRLWYIFKPVDPKNNNENPNDDYNLLENDIIKFGNAKFEIIKKHISNSSTEHNNQINNVNHKFGSIFDEFIPEKSNENDTCFFCKDRKLSKEISKVKLRKCDNYAHYECCKEEIKKRYMTEKNEKGNVIRYRKKFNFCEREAPIPPKFFFNFDEEILKNSDYIILESLNEKKNNDIFVVKLDREEITIGRNINNDIIIGDEIIGDDLSISNEHCILSYNKSNGFLTIKDKSTYGTSVLIKGNAKIDKNKKLYFQNGNIYIKAEYYTGKIKTEEGKHKDDSKEINNA